MNLENHEVSVAQKSMGGQVELITIWMKMPSDGIKKIRLASPDVIPRMSKTSRCLSIIGYVSDLGTKLNQGRPGSKFGPSSIRKEARKTSLAWGHTGDRPRQHQ